MKLVIQIPCFNEAETLSATLKEHPKQVPGFDTVEWLIINDGCTDRTVEVAMANNGGAGHIQSLIFASILLGIEVQMMLVDFLADLLAVNRRKIDGGCTVQV